jgi:hypothetical protein
MEKTMGADVNKAAQAEMRALTETEPDETVGGTIPLLLGMLAFEAGMIGGAVAANYYTGTGTPPDDDR